MCLVSSPHNGLMKSHADGAPLPPGVSRTATSSAVSEHDHGVNVPEESIPEDVTCVPLRLHGYEMNDLDPTLKGNNASTCDNSPSTDVARLMSRSENLCVRHQRMADEGANARLQKVRYKTHKCVQRSMHAPAGCYFSTQ